MSGFIELYEYDFALYKTETNRLFLETGEDEGPFKEQMATKLQINTIETTKYHCDYQTGNIF